MNSKFITMLLSLAFSIGLTAMENQDQKTVKAPKVKKYSKEDMEKLCDEPECSPDCGQSDQMDQFDKKDAIYEETLEKNYEQNDQFGDIEQEQKGECDQTNDQFDNDQDYKDKDDDLEDQCGQYDGDDKLEDLEQYSKGEQFEEQSLSDSFDDEKDNQQ